MLQRKCNDEISCEFNKNRKKFEVLSTDTHSNMMLASIHWRIENMQKSIKLDNNYHFMTNRQKKEKIKHSQILSNRGSNRINTTQT